MGTPDIFFSYAREDQVRVAPLVAALEARGWSVFWDRRIPAGQTWRNYIGRALDQARCVVVAWSAHSIRSEWVIEEAARGQRRHILVPVLLDQVDPPLGFGEIQAADLSGWSPERSSPAFDSFLAYLGTVLGVPHPVLTLPQPWWSRVGPKLKAGRYWLGMVLVVGIIAVGGYAYLGLRPPLEPALMDQKAVPTLAPASPAEIEAALGLGRADWRHLQDALTVFGFHIHSDGKPGPNTRKAIAAWQANKRMEVTVTLPRRIGPGRG